MTKPRVITPKEAQEELGYLSSLACVGDMPDWAYTVATEPERIAEAERRGAVKALNRLVAEHSRWEFARTIAARANAIENGVDL